MGSFGNAVRVRILLIMGGDSADRGHPLLRLSLFQNQRSELSRGPLEGLWETVPG